MHALRQSESRFSVLFQTSPIGMILGLVSDQRFADVNRAWLQMFGYERNEVLGRNGLDLGVWCDTEARADTLQHIKDSGHVDSIESRFRLRGTTREMAFSAVRVVIGSEDCMLCSFVDVTPQREATRLLARQAQHLEAEVSRRSAELNSIFQALPDMYFRMAADHHPRPPRQPAGRSGRAARAAARAVHAGSAAARGLAR
jgi:PAS domain S-box-containing protein